MGIVNDKIYISKHLSQFTGPYLETGSKDYGVTENLRSLFPDTDTYLSTDLEEGKGVDVAMDLADDISNLNAKLEQQKFGTILCLSVLEHCENPFRVADNLTALLKPGGKICIGAPFSFGFHGYPSDYWRFTHEGIRKLFPNLHFDSKYIYWATTQKNKIYEIDNNVGRTYLRSSKYFQNGQWGKGIAIKSLSLLASAGLLKWLLGYKYIMPPSLIYMIGEKKQ